MQAALPAADFTPILIGPRSAQEAYLADRDNVAGVHGVLPDGRRTVQVRLIPTADGHHPGRTGHPGRAAGEVYPRYPDRRYPAHPDGDAAAYPAARGGELRPVSSPPDRWWAGLPTGRKATIGAVATVVGCVEMVGVYVATTALVTWMVGVIVAAVGAAVAAVASVAGGLAAAAVAVVVVAVVRGRSITVSQNVTING